VTEEVLLQECEFKAEGGWKAEEAFPHKAAASADCCSLPKIIIIFSNLNFDLRPSSNLLLTSQDPCHIRPI
jgi:hypothetical protein